MIKPRKRLLDTEAIAKHYGVAPGTVRSWANRHGWTPYGGRRTRQWDLNEAQVTVDELEAKKAMDELSGFELIPHGGAPGSRDWGLQLQDHRCGWVVEISGDDRLLSETVRTALEHRRSGCSGRGSAPRREDETLLALRPARNVT